MIRKGEEPDRDYYSEWWSSLMAQWGKRESGNVSIVSGRRLFEQACDEEKQLLVVGLVEHVLAQQRQWSVAAGILEGLASDSDLEKIEVLAGRLANYHTHSEESEFVDLLRVLAKGDKRFHGPIAEYQKRSPLPLYYSSLQWAFWPQHPQEFVNAYSRFLEEEPADRWSGTAIVQSFVSRPDALRALRDACADARWWPAFESSLREQLTRPWVAQSQKDEVETVLAGSKKACG